MAAVPLGLHKASKCMFRLFSLALEPPARIVLVSLVLVLVGTLVSRKPLRRGAKSPPTLLTLPPELRQMILAHVLITEARLEPYQVTQSFWTPALCVCKLINREGTELLYQRNQFHLDEPVLAIQFFSRDAYAARSLIRDLTIEFGVDVGNLHRVDHPTADHIASGSQARYHDIERLAAHMHQWTFALDNIPEQVGSIAIIPYNFVWACNHIQQGWPLSATWFCPGCGLQQFCRDHPLEEFLPLTLRQRVHWMQGPQNIIAYLPQQRGQASRRALQIRRKFLFEVSKGRVPQVVNRP